MKKIRFCIAAVCTILTVGMILSSSAEAAQAKQMYTVCNSAIPAVINKPYLAKEKEDAAAGDQADLHNTLESDAFEVLTDIPEEVMESTTEVEKSIKDPTNNTAHEEKTDKAAADAVVTPEVSQPSGEEHPKNEEEIPEKNEAVKPPEDTISEYEEKVAELVNQIRIENDLSPLTLNRELSAVARKKSQDMKENHYFNHTSPVYGSPFDMIKTFGISYSTAGENIAMGQRTPEEVVNAWMNSEGHRANILNASFTQIGIGYVAEGNYWTQMFIG